MANEIRYSLSLQLANGGLNDTYNQSGLTANQISQELVRNVQTVSTLWSGDALDKGSVTTPRMAVFANLDATNFIEVGVSVSGDFHAFLRLDAGKQSGPMSLGCVNNAPYARANTGPVKLFYIIYGA